VPDRVIVGGSAASTPRHPPGPAPATTARHNQVCRPAHHSPDQLRLSGIVSRHGTTAQVKSQAQRSSPPAGALDPAGLADSGRRTSDSFSFSLLSSGPERQSALRTASTITRHAPTMPRTRLPTQRAETDICLGHVRWPASGVADLHSYCGGSSGQATSPSKFSYVNLEAHA
jgi:hypothetical protein